VNGLPAADAIKNLFAGIVELFDECRERRRDGRRERVILVLLRLLEISFDERQRPSHMPRCDY
jgi:hypothetical protein